MQLSLHLLSYRECGEFIIQLGVPSPESSSIWYGVLFCTKAAVMPLLQLSNTVIRWRVHVPVCWHLQLCDVPAHNLIIIRLLLYHIVACKSRLYSPLPPSRRWWLARRLYWETRESKVMMQSVYSCYCPRREVLVYRDLMSKRIFLLVFMLSNHKETLRLCYRLYYL